MLLSWSFFSYLNFGKIRELGVILFTPLPPHPSSPNILTLSVILDWKWHQQPLEFDRHARWGHQHISSELTCLHLSSTDLTQPHLSSSGGGGKEACPLRSAQDAAGQPELLCLAPRGLYQWVQPAGPHAALDLLHRGPAGRGPAHLDKLEHNSFCGEQTGSWLLEHNKNTISSISRNWVVGVLTSLSTSSGGQINKVWVARARRTKHFCFFFRFIDLQKKFKAIQA